MCYISPRSLKQMFTLCLLSQAPDGSRSWLFAPADPQITLQTCRQRRLRKKAATRSSSAVLEATPWSPVVFHTCIQEAESRVSINHCQPFLLGYNFPKDEVVQHVGESFCSQFLWVSYNVFQPLTWATSCIEFYYTDMIARQFHTYPILSKG